MVSLYSEIMPIHNSAEVFNHERRKCGHDFLKKLWFYPKSKKLGVNIPTKILEKHVSSRRKTFFWTKYAQVSGQQSDFSLHFGLSKNQFSISKIPWNFKSEKYRFSIKIIIFSIKYAQHSSKWGMFQNLNFLIFKSCPVCFFEISRIASELWGKNGIYPKLLAYC